MVKVDICEKCGREANSGVETVSCDECGKVIKSGSEYLEIEDTTIEGMVSTRGKEDIWSDDIVKTISINEGDPQFCGKKCYKKYLGKLIDKAVDKKKKKAKKKSTKKGG